MPPSPASSTAAASHPALPPVDHQIPRRSHADGIANLALSMETSIASCVKDFPSSPPVPAGCQNDLFPGFPHDFTSDYDQFASLLNACSNLQQLHPDDGNSTSGSDAANYDRSSITKYDQEVSSTISNQDTVLSNPFANKASTVNAAKSSDQIIDDDDDDDDDDDECVDLSSCFSAGWG
jgi:hypothetical protein